MSLSPHFTLAEMTRTGQSALAVKNANEAHPYIPALTALCSTILEPIRARFGPVKVNSGFRGPAVNAAVGGSATSQHSKGEAVDFSVPGHACEEVIAWMRESNLPVDQCIGETRAGSGPFTWIHASYGPRNRRQYLQSLDGKTYSPLPP